MTVSTAHAPGHARTLVVGGGLAGLLAARRHLAAGRGVLLLEAEAEVGGAIAAAGIRAAADGAGTEGAATAGTATDGAALGEIAVNIGAEAYSTGSGAVDALVAELGLADCIVSPRTGLGSRVVSAGGVHRAPAGGLLGVPGRPLAADVRAVLGLRGSLRAVLEPLLPARVGSRPGATVAEVVGRRLGRAVLERLVAPIIGGVHSSDPARLEFAAASPQLAKGLVENGSLVRTVRALRGGTDVKGAGAKSAGTRVHALTPTMAALPARLREEILAAGGTVRTGTSADAVERTATGWRVRTGEETFEAEHLVLACPPDLSRALLSAPTLDAAAAPEIAAAIPETPSAPVRLVALVLDAEALDAHPSGTGALVAPGTPGIRAKALTHASAKWEHIDRALREALPGARSPHLVRLSYGRPGEAPPGKDGIVDLALADASRILTVPLGRTQLLGSAVIDWDRAMRQPGPGHRAALDALTALLKTEPTLELVGSWRAGTGIDAIVRAHRDAARPSAASRAAASPSAAPTNSPTHHSHGTPARMEGTRP